MQARHLPELLEPERGELDVPPHRQVGAVELQDEAGPRHRLVLVPHGVRDGEQIGLMAAVVVVSEKEGDDAGRGRADEHVVRRDVRDGRLQVVHVGLGRTRIADGDGAGTGRRLPSRPAGIAEHPLGHLGEVHQVLVLQRLARAAEPGQPVLDVGRVARLADLAVVDDRDAGVDLLADDLGHRRPDARAQGGAVHRDPLFPGKHSADQVGGPGQAAGVGGQDAVDAPFHRVRSSGRHLTPERGAGGFPGKMAA